MEATGRRRAPLWRRIVGSDNVAGWSLAGPAIFMMALFSIYPVVWSVI